MKFSFEELNTDGNYAAKLLNYKFFSLFPRGSQSGPSHPYSNNISAIGNQSDFYCKPMSNYTCLEYNRGSYSQETTQTVLYINMYTLKDCCPVSAEHLNFSINDFIFETSFRKLLKLILVPSIHRHRDEQYPVNSKAISITSPLSYIFEKVLEIQMLEYHDQNDCVSRSERNNHYRCALFGTGKFHKYVNDNKYVCTAFLDLPRASQSIWQEFLLAKLQHDLSYSD